jgi:hypothetical protein
VFWRNGVSAWAVAAQNGSTWCHGRDILPQIILGNLRRTSPI